MKKSNTKEQSILHKIYDEETIMNFMEDISYGWVDKNNCKHYKVDDTFSDNYVLQDPASTIYTKVGICWDQVELERYYFGTSYDNIKTYFIVHYDGKNCPTHTFLTYKKDNHFYWFEHSWTIFKGIHEYNSLKELLTDARDKFIKYELHNGYDEMSLVINEYEKPRSGISVQEFYKHCENSKQIQIKDLN